MKKLIRHVLGISPHSGWAACVIVGGTPAEPKIVANQVIRYADDKERFCYHAAAEMELVAAERWLSQMKRHATANARRALQPLLAEADICAIAAKDRQPGTLAYILAAHPRIHAAEGCFHRDVIRDACTIPVELVPPASLDPGRVGKLSTSPWGRDQKIAALAGWAVLDLNCA
ncbi:MAG: hypothetical protein ACT4N8_13765 [Sphingosinicella sp.]|uniref:hypothetical protein n=1 Tax=Sphingosinicella sp. TaxID=1917971 RepID=UPI0040384E15